jgi:hypothetical protein
MPFEIFILPGILCFAYAFYKAYHSSNAGKEEEL